MKKRKRTLSLMLGIVILLCIVTPFFGFSSTAQEYSSYEPVSIGMEITGYSVYVDGIAKGDVFDISKLKGAGNHYQGTFSMDSDGNVVVFSPDIDGQYGGTVSSGNGVTQMSFNMHCPSLSGRGNISNSSHNDASLYFAEGTSIGSVSTSAGICEVALLIGAEYQETEKGAYDALDKVVNSLNLASSNGLYVCYLDGTGSIRVEEHDDFTSVILRANASSYQYYLYGRLSKEGSGGGVSVTMRTTDDINLSPTSSPFPNPNGVNQHDIITNTPNTSGEFGGGENIANVIIAGIGGTMAGIGAAIASKKRSKKKSKKKDDEDEEESTFKMVINKNFGNKIRKSDPPVAVYARIVEIKKSGHEISRDDMTALIQVSSYDKSLNVSDGGMVNGYKCAMASVPQDNHNPLGLVTFSLHTQTGSYLKSVMFIISEPMIFFAQDNLGLPANKLKYAIDSKDNNLGDQSYRLPFGVREMGDDVRVTATLARAGITNVEGNSVGKVPSGMPFSVTIEQDKDNRFVFDAVIKEVMDYELPAGNTEGIRMHLMAESGTPGTPDYQKVETDFPLYRIHLGLALTLDASSIGCYMQLRSDVKGAKQAHLSEAERMSLGIITAAAGMACLEADRWRNGGPTLRDYEPCYTGGSLILFLHREEDMSIVRVPVSPEPDVKVTAKRLSNDRYAHAGDASENHQKMVDDLQIKAFSTGYLLGNGAHKIQLCSTAAGLDPPIRIISDLEIKAVYNGKEYTAKKEVLLRSQPFRIANSMEEEAKFDKEDAHIRERLERIQDLVLREFHLVHMFSHYDLIERMLDGYDKRFGYDANQVQNAVKMWTDYINGDFKGANGDAQAVTLADELAACYAFMEGLRDNTGFLGRVALGVITAGYSEYVFTTMTLSEELKKKVFACKGDNDYGFWDAVWLGTKEFGKQIVTEFAVKGVATGTQIYTKAVFDIDIAGYVGKLGETYTAKMNKWDQCLQNNFKLYKAGADALKKTKNFFNSSAKSAKKAIDQEVVAYEESFAKAKDISKKARSKMTPEELKLVDEYYDAMQNGMEKVRKLQKAQKHMETVTDFEAHKLAKKKYREAANEVWRDKNALKQLQQVKGEGANRLRAQFNHYREPLCDTVQLKALADVSEITGYPKEQLYIMNASNGSKVAYQKGLKVPGDRDITIKLKNLSDRTKDLTIAQSVGQEAVAKRFYKEFYGREPASIKEAIKFMREMDVTYVHPDGDSMVSYIFEHNLDGYEDLVGMVGMKSNGTIDKSLLSKNLHNKTINQASVAHKGKEWFGWADDSISEAAKLEAKAATLSGKEAEALMKEALEMRYFAQGELVEGIRQITKQIENIAIPRSIARNGINAIPTKAMLIHRMALRVGDTLSPAEFKYILKNYYDLTLEGYADMMSKYVD